MNTILSVTNLTKTFGGLLAVDNLSFDLAQGEILGFLGANGAGKTTTMRMLSGYIEPTSGDIGYLNTSISRDPLLIKKNLGYLPEGCPLYLDMSVIGFLTFIAQAHAVHSKQLPDRLHYVIDRLQLQKVAYHNIRTLSKGFKRRVGLAQAIIHDPKLLILDEPTDGLDPLQQDEVYKLLKELAKDKAIILSTHNLEEATLLSSRVLIIHMGKQVALDTPTAITQNVKKAQNFSEAFKSLVRHQE